LPSLEFGRLAPPQKAALLSGAQRSGTRVKGRRPAQNCFTVSPELRDPFLQHPLLLEQGCLGCGQTHHPVKRTLSLPVQVSLLGLGYSFLAENVASLQSGYLGLNSMNRCFKIADFGDKDGVFDSVLANRENRCRVRPLATAPNIYQRRLIGVSPTLAVGWCSSGTCWMFSHAKRTETDCRKANGKQTRSEHCRRAQWKKNEPWRK